jgi:hypothetical protein
MIRGRIILSFSVILIYTGGSDGFVTSTAAPIVTGWIDPVPGRVCLPVWTSAFPRRTEKSLLRSKSPGRGFE